MKSTAFYISMLILFSACKVFESKKNAIGFNPLEVDQEKTAIRSEVSIETPVQQNIIEYLQLNAVTLFQKKDNIRSNNTGYITSLTYKIGDRIHAGDLFCKLSTKEQAALKNISSTDTMLLKFQHPLNVPANGTGIITAVNILQGDYIAEGDILATVSEPGSLIAVVNVPYEYNQYVKIGTRCELILPDKKTFSAMISGILPTVDAVSQSQSYFIKLSNQTIPENLNITVRLPYHQSVHALCVSNQAVQTDELQHEFWLMKLIAGERAIKVPISTGLRNELYTEIKSSTITLKDTIINEGAYELADSSLVTVIK